MIVFTDADFLSNAFIDQFSNGQMAVNIINWLVDVDFQTDLSSKSAKTDIARLDLTSSQKLIVAWVLIAMPAVLLMCGVIIWGRRR
jgi:ABC-type uncharacterized transport system involved in gliding motility auxiliary subunit